MAAFTLAGCGGGSSSDSGVALTAITTEADAVAATKALSSDQGVEATFDAALPTVPAEVSGYLAPKALAPKSHADRMAAIKVKKASKANAPAITPLVCLTGIGEESSETIESDYFWSLSATDCVLQLASAPADTCTLNGTSSWKDELLASTATSETWRYSEQQGNGNGVAEATDFTVTCTVGDVTTTWTSDGAFTDTYTWNTVVATDDTFSGSEKGAFKVEDTNNFAASAKYTDSWQGSERWNYDPDTDFFTSSSNESYSGSVTAKVDLDTTDSNVEIDFVASESGSNTYTDVRNATEDYYAETFDQILTFTTPEAGCGSGTYKAVGETRYDNNTGDETGTITVNGIMQIEYLAGSDAIVLTLNGVVIDTVTTEADFDAWVATGTCSLFDNSQQPI